MPYLNIINFDLTQTSGKYIGKRFEIQIELQDSSRKISKGTPTSQVLITPEFYGFELYSQAEELKVPNVDLTDDLLNLNLSVPLATAKQDKFITSEEGCEELQFLNHVSINGVKYDVYAGSNAAQKHIQNNKLFKMNV